jgi:hypothetical protein
LKRKRTILNLTLFRYFDPVKEAVPVTLQYSKYQLFNTIII